MAAPDVKPSNKFPEHHPSPVPPLCGGDDTPSLSVSQRVAIFGLPAGFPILNLLTQAKDFSSRSIKDRPLPFGPYPKPVSGPFVQVFNNVSLHRLCSYIVLEVSTGLALISMVPSLGVARSPYLEPSLGLARSPLLLRPSRPLARSEVLGTISAYGSLTCIGTHSFLGPLAWDGTLWDCWLALTFWNALL